MRYAILDFIQQKTEKECSFLQKTCTWILLFILVLVLVSCGSLTVLNAAQAVEKLGEHLTDAWILEHGLKLIGNP